MMKRLKEELILFLTCFLSGAAGGAAFMILEQLWQ